MELWRSFFQDSRNRPVDKFGKDYSAPKCSTCKGEGKIEIPEKGKLDENEPSEKVCPNCKGERVDSDSIPTYGDEIQKVAREFPDGERAIRVTWESVSDFNARLSNNLRWNLDEALEECSGTSQSPSVQFSNRIPLGASMCYKGYNQQCLEISFGCLIIIL